MKIEEQEQVADITLQTQTSRGTLLAHKARIRVTPTRIFFEKSPFALKDEIKAMMGAKWHGYDRENPLKQWSIDNCQRNWFQLKYLMGENPYAWFEQELTQHEYPLFEIPDPTNHGELIQVAPRAHQRLMADTGLTYHYQIWGAEMGTGKTLSAILVMMLSGVKEWLWVGPLKSMENIRLEFEKWNFPFDEINVRFTTYERLVTYMSNLKPNDPIPQGLICDESSRLKTYSTQRSKATQELADKIRARYGMKGYVILMSGTPSPKSPLDWWKQCEIAWPGFLKEGSDKALQKRLAFMVDVEFDDGIYQKRKGWRDDENKCEVCGEFEEIGDHRPPDMNGAEFVGGSEWHPFKKSFNEVAFMYERLEGLVTILHKKDCLDLPDKVYEEDICKPNASTMRAAKALMQSAPNAITGMTWLRELSDGFMYKDVDDGETTCTVCKNAPEGLEGQVKEWYDPEDPEMTFSDTDFLDPDYVDKLKTRYVACPRCAGTQRMTKYKRTIREVPCPKEAALEVRLEQCEEQGRIVIFAGFQGSLDRIQNICHKNGWAVVRCDGRGWKVTDSDNNLIKTDSPLLFWKDFSNQRVAFIAHPQSGGLSLNLTESRMAVFWSNDFNPESRSQAEDRIHRMGMDENRGCKIVDLFHLPTDRHVRDVLRENRKLELMTMGEFQQLENALNGM